MISHTQNGFMSFGPWKSRGRINFLRVFFFFFIAYTTLFCRIIPCVLFRSQTIVGLVYANDENLTIFDYGRLYRTKKKKKSATELSRAC